MIKVQKEEFNIFGNYIMEPDHRGIIKFHIYNFITSESKDRQILITQKALNQWGEHLGITFIGTSNPEEAKIKFYWWTQVIKESFDFEDFDGPGGTLARALISSEESDFYGHIHFDINERWNFAPTIDKDTGIIDFHTVLLHEIGHILGLKHSDESPLMKPYYNGVNRVLSLDDINACVELKKKYTFEDEDYGPVQGTTVCLYESDLNEIRKSIIESVNGILKTYDCLNNKIIR